MGILRMYHSRYYCRYRTFIRGGRVADGTVVWRIKDVRCPYSLGEFVFKMNEPKDYEYLLLCDGSTISEENYPELVAVLGGTQLPNLIDRFLQGSVTAGTYKAAGLPNVEGWAYMDGNGSWNTTTDNGGAFAYKKGYNPTIQPETGSELYSPIIGFAMRKVFSIDASLSSSIYGNSNTVQPPAYTAKIYICYAG